MCISLEKNTWKIIFGQGKVRENCRGPSAATLFNVIRPQRSLSPNIARFYVFRTSNGPFNQ